MPMEQFIELEKAYNISIKADTKTGRAALGSMVWIDRYRRRTWLNVRKKEDAFLVLCHNTPFLEVHSNHFVIIAPPPDSKHYTNQMNTIVNVVLPAGKGRYCYISRRWNDRLVMPICSYGKMTTKSRFIDHCILNAEGGMLYSDFDKAVVEVDKEKLMVMKRKIRNYFKPYEVLIRIQSVEDIIKQFSARRTDENMDDLRHRLGLINEAVTAEAVLDKINEHIASGAVMSIEFTTLIALVGDGQSWRSFRYHGHQAFLDRIKRVKAHLRLRFSQECTKVTYEKYVPEEAYAKYQSMVIQQINGLRSLPVPCEAEVSGPRPGAVSPTSNGEARTC